MLSWESKTFAPNRTLSLSIRRPNGLQLTFPGKGNPKRLCAENPELGELQQRRVDGQGQLDRQLRRHHGRQDEGALQEQLVAVAIGVFGSCRRRKELVRVVIVLFRLGRLLALKTKNV